MIKRSSDPGLIQELSHIIQYLNYSLHGVEKSCEDWGGAPCSSGKLAGMAPGSIACAARWKRLGENLSSRPGIVSEGLRVGILGAGAMGVKHLEAWHKLGVPIGGLYARVVDRGRAAAEPYGCPVYDSMDALLREVQIADVCLPTLLHPSAVRQAAEAGCQIVCEKPLALHYQEGEAIFRNCDKAKVRIFVAMVVRFFPAYRAAWERVGSGALGQVEQIALIPRPTPLAEGGMTEWLRTFRRGVLDSLPESLRETVVEETAALLAPALRDEEGNWLADYVRLRFVARA